MPAHLAKTKPFQDLVATGRSVPVCGGIAAQRRLAGYGISEGPAMLQASNKFGSELLLQIICNWNTLLSSRTDP